MLPYLNSQDTGSSAPDEAETANVELEEVYSDASEAKSRSESFEIEGTSSTSRRNGNMLFS